MTKQPKAQVRSATDRGINPIAPAVLAGLVAVVAHLQVVKTGWFHDDWYFLGQAAGVAARGSTLVRCVGYNWYWAILYPLFHLNVIGWGVSRLLLHAGCAIFVTRILARTGAARLAQMIGGVLFAASPLAFEAVYWGTGAVELMGAFFALVAMERWLAGGRRGVVTAMVFGGLAIFSKESGMVLPALFAALLLANRSRDRLSWATVGVLVVLSAVEARFLILDTRGIPTYAPRLGEIPLDYLRFGWWLLAPAPYLDSSKVLNLAQALIGGALWASWLGLGIVLFRRGRPLCLTCAISAILVLAPSAPLGLHLVPRYVYPAVAPAAICVAALLFPAGLSARVPVMLLVLALAVSAWNATTYQLNARWPDGKPSHRLVLKHEIAKMAMPVLTSLPLRRPDRIVILRDPLGLPEAHQLLYDSIGGDVGPRVLLGRDVTVTWTDKLDPSYAGSLVLVENNVTLVSRGRYTPSAGGPPASPPR